MTTTQRCESINSFLKGYMNAHTSLKSFLDQFEKATDRREQSRELVIVNAQRNQQKMKTGHPLEAEAGAYLTPYAYQKAQEQLHCSLSYSCVETEGGFLVAHPRAVSGRRLVHFNTLPEVVYLLFLP